MSFATTAGHRETPRLEIGSAGLQKIFQATEQTPADNTEAVILATAEATVQPKFGVHVQKLGARLVAVNRATKGDNLRGPIQDPTGISAMPAAGALWTPTDFYADFGEKLLPKVAFEIAAPSSAELAIASSFVVAPELPTAAPQSLRAEVAPLPRARVDVPAAFAKLLDKDMAGPVLAYAPAAAVIEAPFNALLSSPAKEAAAKPAKPEADAQTASPKKKSLLGWLARRNLRQFDKDQHDWASAPLPKIVHLAKEQNCLARGVYFEARGESELGQAAVAQVILNRVKNPTYPKSICGVVFQNKTWRGRCQFSFACDGIDDRIESPEAWALAQKVARDVTNGKVWLDEVADSTHYHANYVKPRWARAMKQVDRIGTHIFYRTKNGGWG